MIRSPRSAAASASRQKASAASQRKRMHEADRAAIRNCFDQHFTERRADIGEDLSALIWMSAIDLSAPGKGNDVGAGRGALVGKRHFRGRAESEAVAGTEFVAFAAVDQDERA